VRKRFVVAPPVLAGLLYFFSHLYPWTRACVIRAYPEVHADASAPMGVSSPVIVGPRRPVARLIWCLGLSLDRLSPFSPSPVRSVDPVLSLDRLSPHPHGKTDGVSGDQGNDRGQSQGVP
jgi:hypothetical protein